MTPLEEALKELDDTLTLIAKDERIHKASPENLEWAVKAAINLRYPRLRAAYAALDAAQKTKPEVVDCMSCGWEEELPEGESSLLAFLSHRCASGRQTY